VLVRFISKRFFISTLLIYISIIAIFSIYQISNFFITYHMKSPKILIQTILYFLPIVLFYTATINVSVSVFISSHYLKRIKMFVIPQSFGMPLSYVIKPFIVGSLLISLLNVFLNQYFIPDSVKHLKYIEHVYKKNQSYELGVARNVWIAKEKEDEKTLIGASLVNQDGVFYNINIINIYSDHFKSIIQAKKAFLKDGFLYVKDGTMIDLNPFKKTKFKSIRVKTDMNLSNINLWLKTPDEESISELVKTTLVMKKEGLNIIPYLSTLIFRLEFSFLPFLMVCVIAFYIAKSQNTLNWYRAFLWHAFLFGIGIAIPYSLSSKINLNPLVFIIVYIGMLSYAIKRVFDIKRASF